MWYSKFMASIIAGEIWFTWKARCDYIIKHKPPNYTLIAKMAMDHTHDYKVAPTHHMGMRFFTFNRPAPCTSSAFSTASQNAEIGKGGIGFCIIVYNAYILCAVWPYLVKLKNRYVWKYSTQCVGESQGRGSQLEEDLHQFPIFMEENTRCKDDNKMALYLIDHRSPTKSIKP